MLISRTIQIPVFLRIGRRLLADLPSILSEHNLRFHRSLVVAGPRSAELAGTTVARALGAGPCQVVRANTREEVEAVRGAIRAERADLVVGVGGGTPLDVAKLAAAGERVSFLSVPTTPSNDGIASPVAVVEDGGRPASLPARMPLGVIADLEILREAPLECIRAGVGDLVSNLSAVADWELACRRGRDRMDDFARLLALAGAEGLIRYGEGERRIDPRSPDLLEILVNGLVLSGVAMEIAGSSRPCSGAEHLFSHALDRVAGRPAMHGAQVALGTLLLGELRTDGSRGVQATFARLGVPVRARDLGLSEEEILGGLLRARETRPERYTLLDEIELDEGRAAEAARAAGVIGGS